MSKSVTFRILDEDGGTVVIRDGIRVAFNERGGVTVYTNGDVRVKPAVNDTARPPAKAAPQVGDTMEDGTIYAGISPDTGKSMYTTPTDAPLRMQWRKAMDYAAGLDTHGHKDWRVPSAGELKVLFNNRAAIGGFERGWGRAVIGRSEYTLYARTSGSVTASRTTTATATIW